MASQAAPFCPGGAYANVLNRDGVDLYCTGRFITVATIIGIDGKVIHAHLILGKYGRGDGRVHWIAPEQHFTLFWFLLISIDRDVIHAHRILGENR